MRKDFTPCPFCGGREILKENHPKMKTYWLKCKKCSLRTPPFPVEAMAETYWETRYKIPEQKTVGVQLEDYIL